MSRTLALAKKEGTSSKHTALSFNPGTYLATTNHNSKASITRKGWINSRHRIKTSDSWCGTVLQPGLKFLNVLCVCLSVCIYGVNFRIRSFSSLPHFFFFSAQNFFSHLAPANSFLHSGRWYGALKAFSPNYLYSMCNKLNQISPTQMLLKTCH